MKSGGCRRKGAKAESEIVQLLCELGIPSQRVLGSGAFRGAKSDIKVGVRLNEDGSMPNKDEAVCITRAEVKNRKTNPEYLFDGSAPVAEMIAVLKRKCPEYVFEYMNQDVEAKYTMLRRAKVPRGALAEKDYNQVYCVAMGLNDFVELFKRAYKEDLP